MTLPCSWVTRSVRVEAQIPQRACATRQCPPPIAKVEVSSPGLPRITRLRAKAAALTPKVVPASLQRLSEPSPALSELKYLAPLRDTPSMPSGMTPLLASQPQPQPGQQAKQHCCTRCGKNLWSASALQIHERTHTGEKPLVCNICGRAFTKKGTLKVQYRTHTANNNSARRGRKLAMENPIAALSAEGKRAPEVFPKELLSPTVSVDPATWTQYTSVLNGGLAMKTNGMASIQSGGIPTLPVSLGASSVVSNAFRVQLPDQRGLGCFPDPEKPVVPHGVAKHQFPHFLEENKIAVS